MASTTALKRRITSVKNTKQITKAMELVSASKMRRAQEQALKTRDYSSLAKEILSRLRERIDVKTHPLFKTRKINNKLYIVITSDRGLAGAYNSNILRQLTKKLKMDQESGITPKLMVVGKQASRFASRLQNIDIVSAYSNFPEQPTANDIRPILTTICEYFSNQDFDVVDALYTDYISSIKQEVKLERVLPAAFTDVANSNESPDIIFEPSPQIILNTITERLIDAQLTQIFYESQASEHSMRMMAMKNATDNANELVDDLTLEFNTARQSAITQELAEITGGAEAIK
jgi:F-type H+-transporting ATPase subunit gamma